VGGQIVCREKALALEAGGEVYVVAEGLAERFAAETGLSSPATLATFRAARRR